MRLYLLKAKATVTTAGHNPTRAILVRALNAHDARKVAAASDSTSHAGIWRKLQHSTCKQLKLGGPEAAILIGACVERVLGEVPLDLRSPQELKVLHLQVQAARRNQKKRGKKK